MYDGYQQIISTDFHYFYFFYSKKPEVKPSKSSKPSSGLSHSLFGSDSLEEDDDLFASKVSKMAAHYIHSVYCIYYYITIA